MFVYRTKDGLEFLGSINLAEKERLEKEYGSKKAKGDSELLTEFNFADPDTVAALEEAKAPEPVPEPPSEEAEPELKSALDQDDSIDTSSRPNKSASKHDWVDYAVSQGADREEAEALTKDDLVEIYFGEE